MQPKELPWDSAFFGFPVASIEIRGNQDFNFNSLPYKLLYVFSDVELISNFQGYELGQHAAKICFEKQLLVPGIEACENIHQAFTPSKQLLELAYLAGNKSRYKEDVHISEQSFKNLYHTWLLNSFNGKQADVVFTYQINKKVVGFISIKKRKSIARIVLVAVQEQFQMNNIGKALISAAEAWAFKNMCTRIEVNTQGHNHAAIKLYTSCLFQEKNKIYVQHLWKTDAALPICN